MDVRAYPSDLGLSVYFQDITPRKLVEEELRRLLEQLETERARARVDHCSARRGAVDRRS